MLINLAGEWNIQLEKDEFEKDCPSPQTGKIILPNSLQNAGYGYPIHRATQWVSGLHNPLWYEREEYQYAQQDGCNVPFLPQPKRHFIGVAWYERKFVVPEEKEWTFRAEITRWKTTVYIDGEYKGDDCSLCTAHEIHCGRLSKGEHTIRVMVDNRMQAPYRPDGHGVSDAFSATWNGMVGEIAMLSGEEISRRQSEKAEYARNHPRKIEVLDGEFCVDGKPEYFRGTHFGGDYPLTGYPSMDETWWEKVLGTVKEWGLNFIRCHSYCPPEVAFQVADRLGVYLQPECGMWNIFNEGSQMLPILQSETKRILKEFGHHPSFVLFSPTNEPGGEWYKVLREWVTYAREIDKQLGYEGRRLYTAQSGWFYDVPPSEVEGTDYLYFHRSAYGPIYGGNIRNHEGWRGKDYGPSLEGSKLPTICHEMGQWCSYPNFKIKDKFTGFWEPGSYRIYEENAKAKGVFAFNEDFVECSGKNQVRLYKEDVEANFRTPTLYGFEMLDLHDYLGQGTALVGMLDAFWDNKGYVKPEEFRECCNETVILTRLTSYVYKNTEQLITPVEICHFGKEDLLDKDVHWRLINKKTKQCVSNGRFYCARIKIGKNTLIGTITQPLEMIGENAHLMLEICFDNIVNHWDIHVFCECDELPNNVLYTRDASEAEEALANGKTVVFNPYLSEMDYECPPLSYKNVFWNAQMGPGWNRTLGISVDTKHPIFKNFPSEHAGGWQWEDILEHARGFCVDGLSQEANVLVRAIDDWNRNLPLALLLEAMVGEGRLILVAANLEGDFQNRPAAYCFKQAIRRYALEGNYVPAPSISFEGIKKHLVSWRPLGELALPNSENETLLDPNPNHAYRKEADNYPIDIDVKLKDIMEISGIIYMPVQRDRMFRGCIKDYEILVKDEDAWKCVEQGTFQNSLFSQKVNFDPVKTKEIRLRVLSCYGEGPRPVWIEEHDGWRREIVTPRPCVQIGAIQLVVEGERCPNDNLFWKKHQKSSTKEIEN